MKEFDEFLKQACPGLELAWRKYRRGQARKGVERRMRELGLSGFGAYLDYLRADPREARTLPNIMAVTVSRFFRERACWDDLAEHVLPELVRAAGERPVRALSAGCCGGEEPYTLALAWKERVEPEFSGARVEIIGADLNRASLDRAAKARYAHRTLREMDADTRDRWFARKGDDYVLSPGIRDMVEFLPLDLARDEPPGVFDLVMCRYLFFTYFTGGRRLGAAERIWRALLPGGALMIGAREELTGGERELFSPRPGVRCVYVKRVSGQGE